MRAPLSLIRRKVYGTHDDPHHNERELGRALKGIRDQVVIASKCGIRFDESAPGVSKLLIADVRPAVLRASLEGSLERLQTDHIDLYYLHRVDPKTPIKVVAETMKQFIQEGKILP